MKTDSKKDIFLPYLKVRLCRYCAQKLNLWNEWKSNYCPYDHATSMPCEECDGQNLRDPLASFTVRLSLSSNQANSVTEKP